MSLLSEAYEVCFFIKIQLGGYFLWFIKSFVNKYLPFQGTTVPIMKEFDKKGKSLLAKQMLITLT